MSCSNGPIDCFPPRCKKDQLVCFNQCLSVTQTCLEPAATKHGRKCCTKQEDSQAYFVNPFHTINAFIFNGTVVLTNDSTSGCDIRYEVVDGNGTNVYDVAPGTSHAVVVENLRLIDVIPNTDESSNTVATGEIILQLFYILKLNAC